MRPLSACVPLKDPPSTTKYPPSLLPLHLPSCSMSFAILMCIEVDAGADNAARSTFAIRPQFKYTLSTRRLAYTLLYVGRKLVWLCHNSRIVWQAHWHWLIASLDQPIMLMGPPSSVNVLLHCCCMLPMTMQGSFRQCDNATMRSPFGLCWLHPRAVIRPVKCLIKRRHLRPSHAPYRAAKLRQISLSLFLSLSLSPCCSFSVASKLLLL